MTPTLPEINKVYEPHQAPEILIVALYNQVDTLPERAPNRLNVGVSEDPPRFYFLLHWGFIVHLMEGLIFRFG
jgi:hypothetical protein